MAYEDDPAPTFSNQATPDISLAQLVKWYRKVGLDNVNKKWAHERQYKGYARLRGDSIVHCGRTFLGEEQYVALIHKIGYGKWEEAARKDWHKMQAVIQDEREYAEQCAADAWTRNAERLAAKREDVDV